MRVIEHPFNLAKSRQLLSLLRRKETNFLINSSKKFNDAIKNHISFHQFQYIFRSEMRAKTNIRRDKSVKKNS